MTQANAGQFRNVMTVQSRTTATGTRGQSTEVWSDVEKRFCQITQLTGSEREQARRINETTTHEVVMRKPRSYTLDSNYRLKLGDEIYGIGAVIIEGEKRDDIRCLCSRGVD